MMWCSQPPLQKLSYLSVTVYCQTFTPIFGTGFLAKQAKYLLLARKYWLVVVHEPGMTRHLNLPPRWKKAILEDLGKASRNGVFTDETIAYH